MRFQFHENRTSMLQTEGLTSSWSAESGHGPTIEHVEGPELEPAIWVYYRNEASAEELLALHARARSLGPATLEAFEANLPRSRRAELGLAPVPTQE